MNPLNPGDVISRAFTIYREHAAVLVPSAFIVFLVAGIASYPLRDGVLPLVAIALSTAAVFFYQGIAVLLVDDVRAGRGAPGLGSLFGRVAPLVVGLLLLAVVAGIAIFFGFVLLIVPGLFLLTIWAVAAPAMVIEEENVFASLARSRQLVKGNGWNVFGAVVLVWVMQTVAAMVAFAIGSAGGDLFAALLQLVAIVALAPVSALVGAILFFTLRDVQPPRL